MKKWMKPGNKYFIINIDEPYAEKIYQVLKEGQIAKGEWPEGDISFEEWVKETFWDWEKAEEHLKTSEQAYSEIGTAGYFALTYVIRPLRDRFNKNERTQELYDEILALE